MLPVYEAGNIIVVWAGEDLSKGWAEDTFLTIEPLGERNTVTFGANGEAAFSKMANRGATITMTFQQTAPVNKAISKIAAAQDLIGATLKFAPFQVIDKTGDSINFIAENAVLTEMPSQEFGNTMGEKTWVWVCESYLLSDDPSTITAVLRDYSNFL